MSIMAIPQMAIFASYDAYGGSSTARSDIISFGSLGQATTSCSKMSNAVKDADSIKFLFTCSKEYYINEIFSAGIIEYDQMNSNYTESLKLIT